jgi:hypothetical protein
VVTEVDYQLELLEHIAEISDKRLTLNIHWKWSVDTVKTSNNQVITTHEECWSV